MRELADAIRDRDWPAALDGALARWREHRTIAFATLVTMIGRHVPDATSGDGIAELIARPDDPRVAIRLAAEIVARPDDPSAKSIVERIAALRYSLAIAKATSVWSQLAKPLQNILSLAGSTAPDASDEEARALIREVCDPHIDTLWRSVVEAPGDLERRLVLADALIEQGDPRGEVIALQCRHDGHDEGMRILEARSHEILGETALLVDGISQFSGGLLSSISVGTVTTPHWAWDQPLDQRELCALHDVSPGYVSAWHYAKFLAGLARMPTWVRLERAHLDELRKLGVSCPFRNVEFSMWPPPRDVVGELLAIAAYAPTLEGLAFRVTHWPTLATCIDVAREVRARVPRLRRFLVGLLLGHGDDDDAAVESARELGLLEVVDAPSPPRLAAWP